MMYRTHLAIALLAVILLVPAVEHKISFVIIALAAALLPDIDTPESYAGRKWYFRALQFFVRHRGILHSFTFCILVSLALAVIFPILALGFFLGYGLHLISDSFTREGIAPFWPLRKRATGWMVTGGAGEMTLFVIFLIIDAALFVLMVF